MEYIDTPGSGVAGIVNPEAALIAGRLKTTDMEALTLFQRAFPLSPQRVMDLSEQMRTAGGSGTMTPADKAHFIFETFLPAFYRPDRVPGWVATLQFAIADAGKYAVSVDGSQCNIQKGVAVNPSVEIAMDIETLSGVLKYGILDQANQLETAGFVETPEEDAELSDDMLDVVVGGRGSGASACHMDDAPGGIFPEGPDGGPVSGPCVALLEGGPCGVVDGPVTPVFVCGAEGADPGACGMDYTAPCGGHMCSVVTPDGGAPSVWGGEIGLIDVAGGATCGADVCGADVPGVAGESGADSCTMDVMPLIPGI